MNKKLLSLCVLLSVCLHGVSAEARTLRMSNMATAANVENQLVEQVFIPYIEEKSGGRYKIDLYPNSALGNAETVVQGLVMGTIDLAIDTAGNLDQFCPSLALLDLPYLFKREDIAKVNNSAVGEKLRNTGRRTGLHIIDLNCWFPRNLISRKPMHSMADMQNAKNRTTGSKWQMMGVAAMGLKPVPTPAAEMLTAIQQGMVDCMDINLPSMLSFRVTDVAKHVTITNQAQMMGAIVCSTEFWEELSAEDKALFLEAAHEYSRALDKAVEERTGELIEQLKEEGVEVFVLSEEETAKLKAQTEKNLDGVLSDSDKALLSEIREAVK